MLQDERQEVMQIVGFLTLVSGQYSPYPQIEDDYYYQYIYR